jgi:Transposase IS66 family
VAARRGAPVLPAFRNCGGSRSATRPSACPPVIKAAVAYLHGCQLVGFKRLTELCEGLFGLTISQGAISNMLARMGQPFGAAAQQIAATVRASEVINANYALASIGSFSSGSVTDTRAGYALGLGAEWMFAPGWSTTLEYEYLGFGNHSYNFAGVGTSVDTQVQLVKVGLNYQLRPGGFFGWF